MLHWFKCILFFFILLALSACVDEDYTKISTDFVWEPTVSLPLGYSTFYVPDSVDLPELTDVPQSIDIYDTVYFNPQEVFTHLEFIKNLMYRINITNAYPESIWVNAQYVDEGGNTIGDLFRDGPLEVPGAEINAEGRIVKRNVTLRDVQLTQEEIQNLDKVKKIYLIITLTGLTKDIYQNIKFYEVSVDIGVQAELVVSYI